MAEAWRLRIVRRQWLMLTALAPLMHGLSLEDLARALCVHPRTVRRDVDAMIQAGFPFEWRRSDEDEGGRRIRLRIPLTRRRLVREALEQLMTGDFERQQADGRAG